ncbi:MAG TPA: GNAT family N-acetyltransferase [Terriglobia bacterium]|nr:GNAT family N-acetyltransferase [Terriglobia bacterium]
MEICRIEPTTDPRWETFIQGHPAASIFHTPGWLEALRRTYGYEPVAYAMSAPGGKLISGIPFARINSFLTGRRLVSLPFSDHCQPLVDGAEELQGLLSAAKDDARQRGCKYLEIRPLVSEESSISAATHLARSRSITDHRLDLTRSEAEILQGFHKDCIRRKIARADREKLQYEEGRSEELLAKFCRLNLLTRRRHQVPPQPLAWFRNLMDCLGDRLSIRVASKDDTPIASIITLSFKNVLIDKYNSSDPAFNTLGGTVLLIWRSIQDALSRGMSEFDMGRTDLDNPSLITFKDHWGARRSNVNYYRYPKPETRMSTDSAVVAAAKRLLVTVPDSMFSAVGGLFYRHVG